MIAELIFQFIVYVVFELIFAGIGKLYRWVTNSAAKEPGE